MAIWLDFKKILEWSEHRSFWLDRISDADITTALARPDLLKFVSISRTGCANINALYRFKDIPRHFELDAFRIARLVQQLQRKRIAGVTQRRLTRPMKIDWYMMWAAEPGFVFEGALAIRALQYLGFTAGPFALSGQRAALGRLLVLARVKPPEGAARLYFSDELLGRSAADVRYRQSKAGDADKLAEAAEYGLSKNFR